MFDSFKEKVLVKLRVWIKLSFYNKNNNAIYRAE